LLKELTVLTRDGKFDQEFPLDSFEWRQRSLGFNRSMQRFGEIVQRVLRSLVFS